MRVIRKKIVSDMKAIGLVRKSSLERVQSLDDYCLITSAGYSGRSLLAATSKGSQVNYHHRGPASSSHANQLMKSGQSCLTDGDRYEQTRRVSRYSMFWEQHDNRCTMLTFNSAPQEYQFIFRKVQKAYLGVRQGMLALEELWVFLVESVYQKVSHGFLIFEDQHKLLFRQEVLENCYIAELLKDINRNYA